MEEEFWGPGEPSTGDCVIADSSIEYHHRSVDCQELHQVGQIVDSSYFYHVFQYFCESTPFCPEGYKWVPSLGRVCLKQHELAGKFSNYDFHSANALCARDGTRLFSPYSSTEKTAASEWVISNSRAVSTYEQWHLDYKHKFGEYPTFSYEVFLGKNQMKNILH